MALTAASQRKLAAIRAAADAAKDAAATTDETPADAAEKAAAEHAFMERYATRADAAYRDEVTDIAKLLRAMADRVEREGLRLQYPTEATPNYARASSDVMSALRAVDTSTLVRRAFDAYAARTELTAWEAAH